ncbi:hypothetical protein [Paracoccus benzoatiresistens]|uniref:Uncharacterized protein n=1 Tax=Paracoccus benzoatiresistens TaxID=2997341 RepID=A0ABT4JAZ9_9RHOB|nr:hypothetical protein [Paracoccus sp. EF6]MCZ0964074.1 hypothetical protein [Paracoccus sp. EF6]
MAGTQNFGFTFSKDRASFQSRAQPSDIDTHQRIVALDAAPTTGIAGIGLAQCLIERPGEIDRLIMVHGQPLTCHPLIEAASGLTLAEPQDGSDIAQLAVSYPYPGSGFYLGA